MAFHRNDLTFGEESEVTATSSQPQDLREVLLALKQKIVSLEQELERVRAGKPEKKQEELGASKYQIYFQAPKTVDEATDILRECVKDSLDRKYFREEQPCKIEHVRDESKRW